MMLDLAFAVEHESWGNPLDLCRRAVQTALDMADADLPAGPVEVSLVLADDHRVRELNREWRGKDSPTNVLSFPAYDEDQPDLPEGAPLLLGDIVLAFETCRREAMAEAIAIDDHMAHLVVHGVLHLLGYDHMDDEEAAEMEALEIAVLSQLGIANPYKDESDE